MLLLKDMGVPALLTGLMEQLVHCVLLLNSPYYLSLNPAAEHSPFRVAQEFSLLK